MGEDADLVCGASYHELHGLQEMVYNMTILVLTEAWNRSNRNLKPNDFSLYKEIGIPLDVIYFLLGLIYFSIRPNRILLDLI